MRCGQCPLSPPPPPIKCPQDHVPVADLRCKWGLGARGWAGEAPGGSSWVSKLWAAEKRSTARKPLRRCPHYITDIPATEPAFLVRGASLNAKQDEAPSGRAAEPAEPLLSAAAGGPSGAGGRFQTPRPGQLLDAGRRRTAEGPGGGRRRARG